MKPKKSKLNQEKSNKVIITNTNDENAEVFVLPPDLLQKLGINLGNIHSDPQECYYLQIKENLPMTLPPAITASINHEATTMSSVAKESVKETTILETADLMKQSVLLSPTFITNNPGELEIANVANIPKNDFVAIENMPVIIDQQKNKIPDNKQTPDTENLSCTDHNFISSCEPSDLITLADILVNTTEVPDTDDHLDEAYLSDCSNSNSRALDVPDIFNHIPGINYCPILGYDNKIQIISEEILSPSQLKEIKGLHSPKHSDLITVPVDSLISTKKDLEKFNIVEFASCDNIDKPNNKDSVKSRIENLVLFDKKENKISKPASGNILSFENDSNNVGDFSVDMKVKDVSHVSGADCVDEDIKFESQSNLGVCIDFVVTNIENHLREGENEEVLENFVNEITSNDNNRILEKIEESEKDTAIQKTGSDLLGTVTNVNFDIHNNFFSNKVNQLNVTKVPEAVETIVENHNNGENVPLIFEEYHSNKKIDIQSKLYETEHIDQLPAEIISVVLESDLQAIKSQKKLLKGPLLKLSEESNKQEDRQNSRELKFNDTHLFNMQVDYDSLKLKFNNHNGEKEIFKSPHYKRNVKEPEKIPKGLSKTEQNSNEVEKNVLITKTIVEKGYAANNSVCNTNLTKNCSQIDCELSDTAVVTKLESTLKGKLERKFEDLIERDSNNISKSNGSENSKDQSSKNNQDLCEQNIKVLKDSEYINYHDKNALTLKITDLGEKQTTNILRSDSNNYHDTDQSLESVQDSSLQKTIKIFNLSECANCNDKGKDKLDQNIGLLTEQKQNNITKVSEINDNDNKAIKNIEHSHEIKEDKKQRNHWRQNIHDKNQLSKITKGPHEIKPNNFVKSNDFGDYNKKYKFSENIDGPSEIKTNKLIKYNKWDAKIKCYKGKKQISHISQNSSESKMEHDANGTEKSVSNDKDAEIDTDTEIAMLLCKFAKTRSIYSRLRSKTKKFDKILEKQSQQNPLKTKMHIQGVEKPGGSNDKKTGSKPPVVKTYHKISRPKHTPIEFSPSIFVKENQETQYTIIDITKQNTSVNVNMSNVSRSPTFCLCSDYGRLANYDSKIAYEHIHFWDHKSVDCDKETLFDIYCEKENIVDINIERESVIQDQEDNAELLANNICWHSFELNKEPCKLYDNAKIVDIEQITVEKKCLLCNYTYNPNGNKKNLECKEVKSNDSNYCESNKLNKPKSTTIPSESMDQISLSIKKNNKAVNEIERVVEDKPQKVKDIGSEKKAINIHSIVKSQSQDKVNKIYHKVTEEKSAGDDKKMEKSKEPRATMLTNTLTNDGNITTEIMNTSQATLNINTSEKEKTMESINHRESSTKRKTDSEDKLSKEKSAEGETNVKNHSKKIKECESLVLSAARSSERKKQKTDQSMSRERTTKYAESIESKDKETIATSTTKTENIGPDKIIVNTLNEETKVNNSNKKKRSNVSKGVDNVLSADNIHSAVENNTPFVTPIVMQESTSGHSMSTVVKRKSSRRQNESVENEDPPRKKSVNCGVCNLALAETEWDKHVEEEHCFIAWKSGGAINLEDPDLRKKLHIRAKETKILKCTFCSKVHKNSKNFLEHVQKCLKSDTKNMTPATSSKNLSFEVSNLPQTTSTEIVVNSVHNAICGVCKEVVSVSNWIEHIAKNHDYVSWKDGEDPLNVEDSWRVQRYLNDLSKEIGGLVCSKCGLKRKYAIPYQQHIKNCDGMNPKKAEERESVDTTLDTSMDVTIKSDTPEMNTSIVQKSKSSGEIVPAKTKTYPVKKSLSSNKIVTCGVCKEKVTDWGEHIFKKHQYLAWKDGEQPIDTKDDGVVQKYLNDLSKEINGLVCYKCGLKRKYAIPYKQHVHSCKGKDRKAEDVYRAIFIGKSLDTTDSLNVKCGVCQEEIDTFMWTQHILKAHQYMAWQDGESVDLNDPEQLEEHLTIILKYDFYLMCYKCGSLHRTTKSYLDHVGVCVADPTKIPKCNEKVTCAICYKEIENGQWTQHKIKIHYNVAWRVGDTPLDVKNPNAIFALTEEYKQQFNKYKCRECGATRASGVGFYAHVIGCGRSEEELELHRNVCEFCNKKYLFFYQNQHMTWHNIKMANKQKREIEEEKALLEKDTPKEEEITEGRGKRKAAEKAQTIIQKFKEERDFSHKCPSCTYGADSKEEIENHVCKKDRGNCSNSEDSCKLSEDSDEESDDTDIESDLSEQENEQQRSRRPYVPPSHRIPRFPYQTNDATKFMKKASLEFQEVHLNSKNLFLDFRNFEYKPVSDDQMSKYMPPLEESCKVKSGNDWETCKRFEATRVKMKLMDGRILGSQRLFTGGYVQCISWVPMDAKEKDSTEHFLAVASYLGSDSPHYNADEIVSHPSLIQIWDFGSFVKPSEFVLGIAHDFGHVWAMSWCPSGARDVSPQDSDTEAKRLGLLAIACSNGCAYVFSVPYPSTIQKKDKTIFKFKPVVELRLTTGADRKIYQATSISWSKQKDHQSIIVGYSDGTLAYFDLATESPLLKAKENDVTILFPFNDERMHSGCITGVDAYPSVEPANSAALMCCASVSGASLVARPGERQWKQQTYAAVGNVHFQPFWPSATLTGDDANMSTAIDELELPGLSRRWGGGSAYAGCWHCGRFALALTPLLRAYTAHPVYCKYKKRKETFALCRMTLLTKKRKKLRNDDLQMTVEPASYEEAITKYGLEFRMDKDAIESTYGKAREYYPERCPERFPLNEVVSMAFCPSAKFHRELAIATHSGVIFLITV